MRALPGSEGGQAWDINDRDQVVGQVRAPGVTARWNADGTILPLGPLPFSLSEGRAINNSSFAGGYVDHPDGTLHATLWNPGGGLRELGTLGGERAFTLHMNERGEAAGYSDDAANVNEVGFFWSPGGGRVPIGAQNGGARLVAGLNDRGEVVGITSTPAGTAAYLWSRARGLVQLPRAGAPESDVFDINNRSESVGRLWRPGGAGAKRGAPLRFALWAPLAGATPAARAGVSFAGAFGFTSEQVSVVSRSGGQVRLEGIGRYNGRPGHRFVVDAVDAGAGGDRLRVRISHLAAGGAELVDFDSAASGTARLATSSQAGDGLAPVEGQLTIS